MVTCELEGRLNVNSNGFVYWYLDIGIGIWRFQLLGESNIGPLSAKIRLGK